MTGSRHLVLKGAAWIAATRVLVSLIGFASTLTLARLLTPADFGLVAISVSISAVIVAITELSLSQALIQLREPEEVHYHTAFTLGLIRAATLAALIAGAAWPVAWAYGDNRLLPIMLVLAASTLAGGLTNPRLVVFQRSLVFRQEFILNVSQKLVGLVVAIVVAVVWHSYWALVAGSVATQLCAIIVSFALVPYSPRLSLAKWRELMSFSIWLTLNFATRTLNWRMDSLVIGYAGGSRSLGFYTMADNLSSLATRETVAPIAATMFPAYARIADDKARLRAAYRRASAMLCAVAFPAGIGFAVAAEPLVPLLLGAKWIEAVPMIRTLAAMVAVSSLGWSMIPLGSALGKTRSVFNREATGLLLRIVFLFAGLWFGKASGVGLVMGVIWGRVVATLIGTVVNMLLVRDLLDLPVSRQAGDVARVAAGCGAMAAVVLSLLTVMGPAGETTGLAIRSLAAVLLGGATFVSVTAALWHFSGRPEGPETELLSIIRRTAGRA